MGASSGEADGGEQWQDDIGQHTEQDWRENGDDQHAILAALTDDGAVPAGVGDDPDRAGGG